MFKEDIYRGLRDDFELSLRSGEESFLCKFMREEKERDIRILIREGMLDISGSKDSDILIQCLQKYLNGILDFMEQSSAYIRKCEEKKELFRLIGIGYLMDIKEDIPAKKTIEQKRDEMTALFEGKNENEIERQKEDLIKAGRMLIRLWDGAQRKDPYIALREEYLDHQLNERTEDEVLAKARSIYRKKYSVRGEVKDILEAKAEMDSPEKLKEIVEQLSCAILITEAKAFLYDAGYPVLRKETKKEFDPDENERTSTDKEKKIARKHDVALDLISSYCDARGISVKGKEAAYTKSCFADMESEEFQDAAENLYYALKEEARTTAYVPLCINEKNGVGLYIIGSENIPEDFYRRKEKAEKNEKKAKWRRICACHYCCLYGYELLKVEDRDDPDRTAEELTIVLSGSICDDFKEAIKTYKIYCSPEGDGFGAYIDKNGEPVKGMDEKFLPYFFTE